MHVYCDIYTLFRKPLMLVFILRHKYIRTPWLHDCVYDASLCCTCISVWFCNVCIVDMPHMSFYIYLMSMSILLAPFLLALYSYKQSCNYVLSAAVSCGPAPDAPANGQRNGSGTMFESTVTYSCNRGYTLQGDSRVTCMANKLWSGRAPTCNRKMFRIRCHYRYTWVSKFCKGNDKVWWQLVQSLLWQD